MLGWIIHIYIYILGGYIIIYTYIDSIYIYIYIYLGKFHNDLTVLPNPGIVVFIREIIPFYGRKIQVGELL